MKITISSIIKGLACLSIMLFFSLSSVGQQHIMHNGAASFTVSAPAKNINGTSQQVTIQLNKQEGTLQLQVPVESFQFTSNYLSETMNETLYERFNSYYMESDQYPMVTYNAEVTNPEEIYWEKDGIYPINTTGTVKIHGVQQMVQSDGYITIKNKIISVKASMTVYPIQYKIRIPSYIGDMYFKKVLVEVTGSFTH